jgi:trehalose 6-phosphate phosphatase
MTMTPFPDLHSALFIDFDGTLADLAPQPDAVQVHPAVPQLLARLDHALQGAIALVSGRPLAELDAYLQPVTLSAAGVHGVERRGADGQLQRVAVDSLQTAATRINTLVQQHPGLRMESKPGAIALHYRQAPALESVCAAVMTEVAAGIDGMELLHGKMVFEIKPRSANKGLAVRSFMAEAPFRQRRPWFFGDDVTDESAFEAVQALGGVAVKIGSGDTCAAHRLPSPEALRAWLADAAARLEALQAAGAAA